LKYNLATSSSNPNAFPSFTPFQPTIKRVCKENIYLYHIKYVIIRDEMKMKMKNNNNQQQVVEIK